MPLIPARLVGMLRTALLMPVASAVVAGCNAPIPAREPLPKGSAGVSADGTVDREQVREAGRSQSYDENPGASDEDVLDSGVVAVIEPQVGVYQLDTVQLAKGYVIGRFRNKTQTGLKRLGLAPGGTTYWFVYKGTDGRFVSSYVADSDSSGYDRANIPMTIHKPSRPWKQSVAQWQLPGVIGEKEGMGALGMVMVGGQPWISCVMTGCCKPLN